jgi:hypothetical protein
LLTPEEAVTLGVSLLLAFSGKLNGVFVAQHDAKFVDTLLEHHSSLLSKRYKVPKDEIQAELETVVAGGSAYRDAHKRASTLPVQAALVGLSISLGWDNRYVTGTVPLGAFIAVLVLTDVDALYGKRVLGMSRATAGYLLLFVAGAIVACLT